MSKYNEAITEALLDGQRYEAGVTAVSAMFESARMNVTRSGHEISRSSVAAVLRRLGQQTSRNGEGTVRFEMYVGDELQQIEIEDVATAYADSRVHRGPLPQQHVWPVREGAAATRRARSMARAIFNDATSIDIDIDGNKLDGAAIKQSWAKLVNAASTEADWLGVDLLISGNGEAVTLPIHEVALSLVPEIDNRPQIGL